jgi:hypothetical protein
MPIVQVNGIDLYHEETGNGAPLLLISGLRACYGLGTLALWKVNRASPTQPT